VRLSAYDLAQDKAAILAAVLERHKTKPAQKVAQVPEPAPAPAKKPKPRPLSRPKHDRALAYQIEALRSDGWLRADILDVLGITLAQYEARRLWSRRKNLKRVVGQARRFVMTDEARQDFKRLTTKDVAKKYKLHPNHVTALRRDHNLPSPNVTKIKVQPHHYRYIYSAMSVSEVSLKTGLSRRQVRYAREKPSVYKDGLLAWRAGLTRQSCPNTDIATRSQWLAGWHDAESMELE